MSPFHPSIQSFYKRDMPENKQDSCPPKQSKPGDGFTEDELANALDPLMRKWNPEREYEEFTIDQLSQGPKAVTFAGRVVNFSTFFGSTPKEPKAKGWHYLLVKDNTAAISVRVSLALEYESSNVVDCDNRSKFTSRTIPILFVSVCSLPSGRLSSQTCPRTQSPSLGFLSLPICSLDVSLPTTLCCIQAPALMVSVAHLFASERASRSKGS